jgi:hypothetical protein
MKQLAEKACHQTCNAICKNTRCSFHVGDTGQKQACRPLLALECPLTCNACEWTAHITYASPNRTANIANVFGYFVEGISLLKLPIATWIITQLQSCMFRKSGGHVLPKPACGDQFSTLCLHLIMETARSGIQYCGGICSRQSICDNGP